MNRPTPYRFAPLALVLALAGCANPYMQSYTSTLDKRTPDEKARFIPSQVEPKLVTSNDMKTDALRLRENGYVLVGRSKFRSPLVDEKQALAQGKKIGAEVVMVAHKFVTTGTESVPVAQWIPGQEVDHTERTVVQHGDSTPTVVDRTTTTVVQGEFQTSYVEQSIDYYDYAATYWVPTRPPVFGVNVKALDPSARAAIGSNKGVLVRVVRKDSPAFNADILRDDVLVSLGDQEIRDPDQFFQLVDQSKGQTLPVVLIRNGQEITVKVALGS